MVILVQYARRATRDERKRWERVTRGLTPDGPTASPDARRPAPDLSEFQNRGWYTKLSTQCVDRTRSRRIHQTKELLDNTRRRTRHEQHPQAHALQWQFLRGPRLAGLKGKKAAAAARDDVPIDGRGPAP